MDLGILNTSAKMTPLLVRLYDSQKLHALAKDEKPAARAELTSAITELLEMELSPRESELVADVMIEILRQAELDLRKALADRLSIMENVPLRLVLQMANDEITVADSVLSKSAILSDLDLIYIIKGQGAEHWQSIAKRQTMSDQIINILADCGDEGTALNLIDNKNIHLTEYSVDVISDMACEAEALQKPLLQREEVTADIARRLYNHVGEALKSYITEKYEVSVSVVDLVDEVIHEFSVAAEANEFKPDAAMLADADRYKEKGLLTIKLILATLRRGQIQAFIAQFARLTGMSPGTVQDILSQHSGQGLAVACRAFDIEKADFISIFLLTNKIREDGSMVDLKDMGKAIDYFARIKPDVAKGIIQNSLDENPKD